MAPLASRDYKLVMDVCNGTTAHEIAPSLFLTPTKVYRILNKIKTRMIIWLRREVKNSGYINDSPYLNVLSIKSSNLNVVEFCKEFSWIFQHYLNFRQSDQAKYDYSLICKDLQEFVDKELSAVTDEWRSITHAILNGTSVENMAATMKISQRVIIKMVRYTCYTINSRVTSKEPWGWIYELEYYHQHKRLFFNPIDLGITFKDLKRLPILDYLEDNEKLQAITFPYLIELFERKYRNIGICIATSEKLHYHEIVIDCNYSDFMYGDNKFVVNFNNGLNESSMNELNDDLIYMFVLIHPSELYHFKNRTESVWVEFMLKLMNTLATPEAQEELAKNI